MCYEFFLASLDSLAICNFENKYIFVKSNHHNYSFYLSIPPPLCQCASNSPFCLETMHMWLILIKPNWNWWSRTVFPIYSSRPQKNQNENWENGTSTAHRQHIRVFVAKLPHVTQHNTKSGSPLDVLYKCVGELYVCETRPKVFTTLQKCWKAFIFSSYLIQFRVLVATANPIALLTPGLHIVSDLTPSVAWRSRLLLLLVINLSGNVDSTYINNNQNNVEMCRACTCALIPISARDCCAHPV